MGDGTLLTQARKSLVRSVAVTSSIDGADELTISANATDPDDRRFRFLGETILRPGSRVIAYAGYGADLAPLNRFTIARLEPRFSADAAPTVTIRGYSAEAELVEGTESRGFEGPIRDSDIVKAIADEYGLFYDEQTVQGTPIRQRGRLKKKGTTDLAFIQGLANANGYGPPVIRYDPDEDVEVISFRRHSLQFQREIARFQHDPIRAGTPDFSGNLLSFDASISLTGVPTKVEIIGWNEDAQEPMKVILELTSNGQRSEILIGQNQVGEVSQRVKSGAELRVAVLAKTGGQAKKEVVTTRTIKTPEDALSFAERWFATRQRAYMEGRFISIGYHRLWAPQIHRFEGLSPELNGLWELQTVEHSFTGQGYRCSGDVIPILEEGTPLEVSA